MSAWRYWTSGRNSYPGRLLGWTDGRFYAGFGPLLFTREVPSGYTVCGSSTFLSYPFFGRNKYRLSTPRNGVRALCNAAVPISGLRPLALHRRANMLHRSSRSCSTGEHPITIGYHSPASRVAKVQTGWEDTYWHCARLSRSMSGPRSLPGVYASRKSVGHRPGARHLVPNRGLSAVST